LRAQSVGRPHSPRAGTRTTPNPARTAGSANNANPVSLVVPCHRVIASDGSLGGYGGGLELKARLLAMEGSRPSSDRLL
jgi:methylated-DNA-[protein]-cysteine S-methyltransferase